MTAYRDGIEATRCGECHGIVHRTDEQPRVSLLRSDVEELLCCLVEYVDCQDVWGDTIARLEQELGQTHRQVNAKLRAAAGLR